MTFTNHRNPNHSRNTDPKHTFRGRLYYAYCKWTVWIYGVMLPGSMATKAEITTCNQYLQRSTSYIKATLSDKFQRNIIKHNDQNFNGTLLSILGFLYNKHLSELCNRAHPKISVTKRVHLYRPLGCKFDLVDINFILTFFLYYCLCALSTFYILFFQSYDFTLK